MHAERRTSMGSSNFRILAAPASDTSELPTVVLQCDSKKYMFNAGEGTTRLSAQHKSTNTRVDHIFLSRVASEAIGGLPGLLMTLADGGKKSINLYGPINTRYAVACTRFYAKRDSMQVNVEDIGFKPSTTPCFADEHVRVYAVPIAPFECVPWRSAGGPIFNEQDKPWRNPQWKPSNLCADQADKWYRITIADAWGTSSEKEEDMRIKTPSRVPHALPPARICPNDCPHGGAELGRQAPVFAYICAGTTQRGKFDAKRAAALGISPGPDFARLTRGEDVQIQRPVDWASLSDAEQAQWLRSRSSKRAQKKQPAPDVPDYILEDVTLRSSDVVGTARAGAVFFYMVLPNPAYIDALLEPDVQASFAPYTQAANMDKAPEQRTTPHAIVHAAPRSVIEDERYAKWMASFGPDCNHIIANKEQCADRLMYPSSAWSLLRLSRLDADMFSVPGYQLVPSEPIRGRGVPATEGMVVPLQPRAPPMQLPATAPPFDVPLSEMTQRLSTHATEQAAEAWAAYEAAVQQAHRAPMAQETLPGDELTFTTLGTGSSSPSKYRNVLSTLVHIPDVGYILLDAGESTYFQLARRFGPGEHGWSGVGIEHVLRNLRMIFVSHIHGDHHMGIVRILLERRKLGLDEPLYFFSNNYTRFYLLEYDHLEKLGLRDGPNGVLALDNELLDFEHGLDPEAPDAKAAKNAEAHAILAAAKARLRLSAIRTAPVVHRTSHCYGLILEHESGWKLVFSGDTMPCDALVAAGKKATILIHEATMQDDEEELAHDKGHSTIGQAVQAAKKMQAKHLLLTHFSQRYPKFARMGTITSVLPTGVAFDMMHITQAQIRRGKEQLPALEALFAAEHEDDDSDAESTAPADAAPEPVPPAKRSRAQDTSPHAFRHNEKEFAWRYVVLSLYVTPLTQRIHRTKNTGPAPVGAIRAARYCAGAADDARRCRLCVRSGRALRRPPTRRRRARCRGGGACAVGARRHAPLDALGVGPRVARDTHCAPAASCRRAERVAQSCDAHE